MPVLHGLALEVLQYKPPSQLAALPRLRTLTLRDKTDSRQVLSATLLPASLEEVVVRRDDPLGNPTTMHWASRRCSSPSTRSAS